VIVAVELLNKSRGKVYVAGQVRTAGAQEIPSSEVYTVSRAILKAGGFSDFADKKNVRLVRKSASKRSEKTLFIVNVAEIWEKGKIEQDLPLQPDDLIFVPERLVNF
jgi:protein involved in polysaccharide export with SLBB domain